MGWHGGYPSLKRIAANNALRAIWRGAVSCSREPIKAQHWPMPCCGKNRACIDQYGAEVLTRKGRAPSWAPSRPLEFGRFLATAERSNRIAQAAVAKLCSYDALQDGRRSLVEKIACTRR
jgi:hypothetical protein